VLGADDDTIAESLRHKVRVLCWVMTQPENHMSRAVHVQATWGRRCNVLLFVTEKDDVGALSVMKVDVATGREHLTAKTMSAFDHVYEHHRDEADWFLKVSRCNLNGKDRSTDYRLTHSDLMSLFYILTYNGEGYPGVHFRCTFSKVFTSGPP